jgi:phosphatidylserine synthase
LIIIGVQHQTSKASALSRGKRRRFCLSFAAMGIGPTKFTPGIAIAAAVTLGNAVCGLIAIVLLIEQMSAASGLEALVWPCRLIILGWLFDMVDGYVARALKASSAFGGELDSLADAITAGAATGALLVIAPVVLKLDAVGTALGWVAGILFLSGVLARLARFNIGQAGDYRASFYFQGMPGIAAVCVAAVVLALHRSIRGIISPPDPGARLACHPSHRDVGGMLGRLPPLPNITAAASLVASCLLNRRPAIGPGPVFALFMLGYMVLSPLLSAAPRARARDGEPSSAARLAFAVFWHVG